jgi:alkyl sulfatase BDS1-like metallo-beta-lactamase superfamily hydrolase
LARVGARKQRPTSNSIAEFFTELGRRGHEPLLAKARGSARFDVADGRRTERWLVTIDKGDLRVSRRSAAADCIVRLDRSSLERAVAGKLNIMAAVLRGEVTVGGDPRLLVLIRRLFLQPSRRRSRTAGKTQ